jgi:NAD(P)-dependent dehydrogenase (short-subunit alcohol dehydrogenase family)
MLSLRLLGLWKTIQPLSEYTCNRRPFAILKTGDDSALSSYPADRAKQLFDVNVHGVFYTAREAARNMITNGGGSIILISSMSANVSSPVPLRRSARPVMS